MITGVLAALAAGSLVYLLLAHLATLSHFRPGRSDALSQGEKGPEPWTPPSVSILKPIEGAGDQTFDALVSFCDIDYEGPWELLVGTLSREDPIVAVVERLRTERPAARVRLVVAEPLGANRKTAIMHRLAAEARGELLFFSDADVRVESDYLRRLVPELTSPGVGCVTCLPRPVGAETAGGRLVALHYATCYLPQWMAAARTTGIRFAIGMTMAVHRAGLEAIGGFAPFADALADDYELGSRIAAHGRRVVVPACLLDTQMPRESTGAAFRRLLRWKRTIRRCRPADYAGMLFCHPLAWSLLLACVRPGLWPVVAATLLLRWIGAWHLNRAVVRMPGFGRAAWLLPLLDLFEWLTFFGAYLGDTVVWAGRRYRLDRDGNLRPLD